MMLEVDEIDLSDNDYTQVWSKHIMSGTLTKLNIRRILMQIETVGRTLKIKEDQDRSKRKEITRILISAFQFYLNIVKDMYKDVFEFRVWKIFFGVDTVSITIFIKIDGHDYFLDFDYEYHSKNYGLV